MNDTTDPAALAADVRRLREQVRADRRTVTAPLVVFGTLILCHTGLSALAAAVAGSGARHVTVLLYWPLAGAIGLFALWNHAHRLSVREGVGEGPRSYRPITLGYVVSLPVIAVLFIPVLFVGVFASLAWPAAILAAVAVRQRSGALKAVAGGLAGAGLIQGVLAAMQSGSGSGGAWAALGLEAAAGLALLIGAALLIGGLGTASRSPAA